MRKRALGFSMLELLLAILIIGIIAALALPSAFQALQNYHLHADSAALAGSLNVVRMRAAAKYYPYAIDVDPTQATPTYVIERLQKTAYNPLSPSTAGAYTSFSPNPAYELGTQYLSQGDTMALCRPASITTFPTPVLADPATCTGTGQFCFNTRGLPVQCASGTAGAALANGAVVMYIMNQQGATDAVTVSPGGLVQVWNWDTNAATWYLR